MTTPKPMKPQKLSIPDEKKIIVGSEVTYFPRVEEMCCGEKKIYTVEKTMPIPEMHLQVPKLIK
jgi:hypothetical protein